MATQRWSAEEIAALAGDGDQRAAEAAPLSRRQGLGAWVAAGLGVMVCLGLALAAGFAAMGGGAAATATPTATCTATPTVTPTPTATATVTPLKVPTLAAPILAALLAPIGAGGGVPADGATPAALEATAIILASPSATPSPTLTPTPALGITPIGHGRQPIFELAGVAYQANGNANGCQWQSAAGELVLLPGYSGARGFNVHLFAPGADDQNANAGSRPQWGRFGFEFVLDRVAANTAASYGVQVQDAGGRPLSDVYFFPTFADCARNVGVLSFRQVVP